MYLKSIKTHGFKSFADITNIELKPGITGIVGPNGSGKSNIVDAIRWVLGEQSLKALRGTSSMSDVIFSGSKSRNPMTRAYVSLTFDNNDKYLNTEFNEVEIKRVLYKSGENEYFINNSKVRLKDITDLFIDSGAGKESFNIISQGSVADIINSKPEERRIIFESAAGVLKYKKRKEETNRKLIKVHDDLEKIDLIISELKDNHDVLKSQAQKAQIYLENKKELENTEIALIAYDLKNLNTKYQDLKIEVEKLNDEINVSDVTNNKTNEKLENLKLENLKIEEKINNLNEDILKLTEKLAKLDSEKQLTIERKKLEVNNDLLKSNILTLKEEELTINKNSQSVEKDIHLLESDLQKKEEALNKLKEDYQKQKVNNDQNNQILINKNKDKLNLLNQIDILESTIENDEKLPYATKAVLNNPRLKNIFGIVGKLIEVADKYALAIDTALGYSANIIVVKDELSAKEAISYLKQNKLGRATFFPLSLIKPKTINLDVLNKIKKEDGFIGIASELITYDKKYQNVIQNQLGNVIVVKDIDSLNKIGKLISFAYRIVSLDGETTYTNGAIAGGALKQNNGIIMQKEKLNSLKNLLEKMNQENQKLSLKIENATKEMNNLEKEINDLSSIVNDLKEKLIRKNITLQDLKMSYQAKHQELEASINMQDNKLDEALNKLLENYYQTTTQKELVEKDLANYKAQKEEIFMQITQIEKESKDKNSLFNKKLQILKEKEIELGKMDVRLDSLLNTLNETYNMTYEKAQNNYPLEIPEVMARENIVNLRKEMAKLGEVNTGAIEEFERVDSRYKFLTTQKRDLETSIVNLNNIINEMDNIMKERLEETFIKVSNEFKIVFQKLFKGGEGLLKLTDADNLLETGVEIIAHPPGKKLNSIGLLSGGEKTLTAIALLFAILNVNPVPFVILDEVEAALDEANVLMFGKYLTSKKDKSQFIIITHKKKTMEYADSLYGITMQESGISKLVSVKLENI